MNQAKTYENLDELLAEADKLINTVDAMVIQDIADQRRIEIEKCCSELKTKRSTVETMIAESEESDDVSSYADGFHEAYQDIVKAMKGLKKLLT